jgi:hypothetical protein
MNIKDAEDQLKQADSFLTTLGNVLKKHWLLLTAITIGAFLYWAATLPDEEVPYDETEQVE